MRGAITAIVLTAAVLVALSMLGVAAAEAPTGTPTVRTVSVEGVGVVPIGAEDSAAVATAVYREAMAKAVSDGEGKAAFLAGRVEGTLGQPDSVIEGGGYIECRGEANGYAEYEGEQPDFGTGRTSGVVAAPLAASSAPSSSHVSHRPKAKRKHKRPLAKGAATTPACNLTAQVDLVYALD